jgi:uncharacterized protein YcbK (DUF882 family)
MKTRHDEPTAIGSSLLGRRRALGLGLGAALVGMMPASAFATLAPTGNRSVGFFNTHTNEVLKATYWRDGRYDTGALKDINYILRDFRTGDIFRMDTKLLDLLVELHRRTGSRKPFEIISGYRSPKTNAILASESGAVAKHSMHMQGKAIDIRLMDVALSELRTTAMGMKAGGVGYYTRSNFVHVDTGRVRYW